MSIQEGINKALGIGAVLATQSPLMENQKIKAAKKSEVKRLTTQAGLLKDKATAEVDPNNVYEVNTSEEANRQLREVNRRLFELNPTAKTSAGYYSTFSFKELKRMDDANMKAEDLRYNKKAQNQNFKVLKESKKNGKT